MLPPKDWWLKKGDLLAIAADGVSLVDEEQDLSKIFEL
jgi:hypothetical protein